MSKPRWEIMLLAVAILIGAVAIAASLRTNRFLLVSTSSTEWGDVRIVDAHNGALYVLDVTHPASTAEGYLKILEEQGEEAVLEQLESGNWQWKLKVKPVR